MPSSDLPPLFQHPPLASVKAGSSNNWEQKTAMHYNRLSPASGKIRNAAGQLQILVAGGMTLEPAPIRSPAPAEAYTA